MPDNQSITTKTYDTDCAEIYNRKRFSSRRTAYLDKVEKKFAKALMKRVGVDGGILDVPCGAGRFTGFFKAARELYCMDVSEAMLREAKKNGGGITFITGDVRTIPLGDEQVDLVFCMRLLHHIADSKTRQEILKELYRVSKQWVAVSFYRKECFRYFKKRLLGKKVSGYPIWSKTFRQEVAVARLKIIQIIPSYLNGSSQTLVLLEKI